MARKKTRARSKRVARSRMSVRTVKGRARKKIESKKRGAIY